MRDVQGTYVRSDAHPQGTNPLKGSDMIGLRYPARSLAIRNRPRDPTLRGLE